MTGIRNYVSVTRPNLIFAQREVCNGMSEEKIESIKEMVNNSLADVRRPIIDLTGVTRFDSLGVRLLVRPLIERKPIIVAPVDSDTVATLRDSLSFAAQSITLYHTLGTALLDRSLR